MKKLLFIGVALFISACSTEETNDPEKGENNPLPDVDIKLISNMTGGDDTQFVYSDGLLVKGMDKTSGIFFQVKYNSQIKVEKVYTCECGWPENGMEYDIPTDYPESHQSWNYNYSQGKLSKITSSTGKILLELKYSSDKVIEKYEAGRYSDSYDDYELTEYIYDTEGNIESYVFYDSYSEETRSGDIRTDEKVNPLFIIWQEYGLIIPDDICEISTYNIPFFPNNVTEIYEGNELYSKANMTYEGDYPVYYDEIFSEREGAIIDYLEE